VIAAKAEARGVSFEAMYQEYANTASMQTMIGPEDIASMILFICSDAGRLVSGQVLGVDGNVEYLR
jgi:enoyl-[acyl-carrier-protein] reductase (NADH)